MHHAMFVGGVRILAPDRLDCSADAILKRRLRRQIDEFSNFGKIRAIVACFDFARCGRPWNELDGRSSRFSCDRRTSVGQRACWFAAEVEGLPYAIGGRCGKQERLHDVVDVDEIATLIALAVNREGFAAHRLANELVPYAEPTRGGRRIWPIGARKAEDDCLQ